MRWRLVVHARSRTRSLPAPAVVTGSFRCPDPEAAPTSVADHGADTLPAGARAALLCLHDNHLAWVPPRDRLTTGLDRLVALVDAQQVHDPASDLACGGVGAPAWAIVLQYDGGTRTITGDNGGCWDLLVGGTQRVGSAHVFDAYLHALLRQRHGRSPSDVGHARPRCPLRLRSDGAFSPLADASHLASAVLCRVDGTRTVHATRLTRAQVATLRHEFATATTRRTRSDVLARCHPVTPGVAGAVVGVDDWGDPVTVLLDCGAYRTVQPGEDHYLFARMLPATARMVNGLLDR